MKDVFLCLDVGGTQIKGAAIGKDGEMCGNILYFDSRAGEGKGALLEHFAEILRRILPQGAEAAGIRMAFPGPFDYERGICLIRGLDKYESLYGADLRREISGRLGIGPQRVRFANDAAAFALGEMGFGQARGAERVLCACIGTGCGSAFGVAGRLAAEGTPGVPEEGYIYNAPFLEGCVDDYISRRGLMALTRERLGEALDGKALAGRAMEGDDAAGACFLAFGDRIRAALEPFLRAFRPDALCLGGQIMGSAALFLAPVEEFCMAAGIRVCITEDTSLRTLQGLTRIYTA